ncbi:ral-GDS-related protein-like, partial [Fukomys damarensis]|uniref:ral-GDS-related protein-like n=1 Tax=Fukomys damarensis TaxID=885580 RepID=UPI00145508E8
CVQVNSPGADVEPPLLLPLAHGEHPEPCKAETEAPAPYPEQHGPALQPEPAPEKEPPLETGEKQKPAPQHSCVSPVAEKGGSLQKVLLAFSPKLLAEQLTLMDAELFKKVVPWDCLGSVWTHRNKTGNEHLVPTVRATVTHFNLVAECVITSCLGDPSMKARDRASMVEHWIQVARECLRLRNFSSLHAIISALRSTPVHQLSRTWGEVPRKSFLNFQELCAKDSAESRNLLTKEGLSKKATLENNPHRAQMVQQQKGKGNLVNFEKITKEAKVLQEIQLFQVAASKYNFQREEKVEVWFHSREWLSENESYSLSCLLEPRQWRDNSTLRNRKISS